MRQGAAPFRMLPSVLISNVPMPRFSAFGISRTIAATAIASLVLAACSGDKVTGSFDECVDQPGCQSSTATVAPEVINALDDVNSRVVTELEPAARAALKSPLARLETALVQRDIDGGRTALLSALAAITQAERNNEASRPDLGVLRLSLVPAARSLGLPVTITDPPAP